MRIIFKKQKFNFEKFFSYQIIENSNFLNIRQKDKNNNYLGNTELSPLFFIEKLILNDHYLPLISLKLIFRTKTQNIKMT